jgi:hypothetical protein
MLVYAFITITTNSSCVGSARKVSLAGFFRKCEAFSAVQCVADDTPVSRG